MDLSSSSKDDIEDDSEVEERLRVLEESRRLKLMAEFFLHPERPVKSTPAAFGRCYFCRPSAEVQTSQEETDETQDVLIDAKALKKLARDFRHPELPIQCNDGAAYARCYFDRASAPAQVRREMEEEKNRILLDIKALKNAALDYLHPELPVATTDSTIFGRNYFTRFSASEAYTADEEMERELVLSDATKLRKMARNKPVPIEVDPAAMGRNYFCRPSAPTQTTLDEEEEKDRILQDAKALRKFATDFLHPELPVQTHPAVFGRNYFDRLSAADKEENAMDKERQRVLNDAKALHKLATDYLHPELPVQVHPTALGRNYFSRPSAVGEEGAEEGRERQQILSEAKALRKLATDYLHPELPVQVHPTALGRNYFSRLSAFDQEDGEEAEERKKILADAKALHKLAVDYLHPELPIIVTDPTIFGRNYFNRSSASVESSTNQDREQVLADALDLERLAVAYHHPEMPVQTDEQMALSREFYYPKMHASQILHDQAMHEHHVHFDMDDDVHLHHVKFDLHSEHHQEMTELRISSPSATRPVVDDIDLKVAMSPGCVVTFTQKLNQLDLPYLPETIL